MLNPFQNKKKEVFIQKYFLLFIFNFSFSFRVCVYIHLLLKILKYFWLESIFTCLILKVCSLSKRFCKKKKWCFHCSNLFVDVCVISEDIRSMFIGVKGFFSFSFLRSLPHASFHSGSSLCTQKRKKEKRNVVRANKSCLSKEKPLSHFYYFLSISL